MNRSLPDHVQRRVDDYLRAVDAQLQAAGQSGVRRRGVLDDLEAQIVEALTGRIGEPTVNDADGIIGQLDPPTAFAGGEHAVKKTHVRTLSPLRWPITCIAVIVTVGFSILGRMMSSIQSISTGAPPWPHYIAELISSAVVPATIVGVIAWLIERNLRRVGKSFIAALRNRDE